ncbi:MAG TPA: thioesterase family protein [Kofleriaceae bacterium]|nr:thioesterase family protein [Kofleriaceae bacterium]
MPADLAVDTAVTPDPETPGRYHLTLPDHWDYLLPSGGAVMTCALRAAEAALGEPLLRVASATAIFCTPIHPGKLVADVTMLRRGGSTAQVRVWLRHGAPPSGLAGDDNVGLEVTATFCRDRRGPDVTAVTFPAVRPLADALPAQDAAPNNPHERFRIYHQLECRIAEGDRFWTQDWTAGPARYARWMRYRVPQRDAHGRLDRLALLPLIDTMPTVLHRAIGPGGYRYYAPSLDLTTYFIDDTTREWLLIAVALQRARMGWAIAEADVWDDEGRLIAHGAQAMYVQNLSGEPPTVDASGRR